MHYPIIQLYAHLVRVSMGTALLQDVVVVIEDGVDRHVKVVSRTLVSPMSSAAIILILFPSYLYSKMSSSWSLCSTRYLQLHKGVGRPSRLLLTRYIIFALILWVLYVNNITTAVCTPPCQNGDCVTPDQCHCRSGWTGPRCEQGMTT